MKNFLRRAVFLLLVPALLLPCAGCGEKATFTFADGPEWAREFPSQMPPVDLRAEDWVCLTGTDLAVSEFVIPETHKGQPVLAIASGAFMTGNIASPRRVEMPSVVVICDEGLTNTYRLAEVVFRDIRYIGRMAFEGCSSLTELVFPACLEVIAEGAFAGCTGLTKVRFEGDPVLKNCFPANPGLVFYGQPGGNVEEYARAWGIAFEALSA